jgi:hypothetical protein
MAPSMLILIVFTATLACTKRALFITKKAQIVPPVPPPPPPPPLTVPMPLFRIVTILMHHVNIKNSYRY